MCIRDRTITIPYKLEILSYLDEIDPLAKIIGAVNTVRIQDGKLKGFNTDGEGFVRGLEVDGGLIIADQTFLVIGAGGVSRAIMTVLASRRPKKIYLANRTVEKAEEICEKLNREVCPCCVPLPLDCNLEPFAAESTVLINATNIGMPPMEGKSPVDLSLLRPDLFVADVIYNPRRTLLLETAEKMGCQVVNGQSPVSYTHLDVYKRQGLNWNMTGNSWKGTGRRWTGKDRIRINFPEF